jgi:DNA-binding transcriptional MerR regulator
METPATLYTVRDVARIFGLQESRIRYWAQTGFINPSGNEGGKRLYTFLDLIGIRAAKELLDRGIPLQRVRKNLQALREAVPHLPQPLSQLRVRSDGEQLVVADGQGAFDPLSGQLLLDFEIEELRSRVAEVLEITSEASPPAGPPPGSGRILSSEGGTTDAGLAGGPNQQEPADGLPTTAYGWFLRGCGQDGTAASEEEALMAFQKAVELDPSLASAHTNLGNLYYRRAERARARQHYETACTLEPTQAEAHYNLANLYEEEGEMELAIAEHRRALAARPDFPDAHFNLALVLERVGSRVQAVKHWKHYLEIASSIPGAEAEEKTWLDLARSHLASLEGP